MARPSIKQSDLDCQSSEEPLLKPFKAKGATITLFDSGILVCEHQKGFCSCFGGEGKTYKLLWVDICECEFDHTCFSGTLRLKAEDGKTATFSGNIWSMKPAVNIIYKRKRRAENLPKMDKFEKEFRKKIALLGEGLVVKKQTGCFSGSDTLVPWTSVLKVSLHARMFRNKLCFETMLPSQVVGDPGIPRYSSMTIRGSRAALDDLFDMVLSIFKERRVEHDASDLSADRADVKESTMNALGLIGVERSCCSEKRHFVPYHMITSLDWEQPRCAKSKLVIVDRAGQHLALHSVDKGAAVDQAVYEKCRNMWANRNDHPDKAEDFIVRKNMRLSSQGLHLTSGSCLAGHKEKFYNWEQVDVCEIASTCCGAQLTLVTESGDRAGWRGYSKRAMMDTMMQIQKFKYKNTDDMESLHKRYFGGRSKTNSCLLTDRYIRIVTPTGRCSDLQCFLDLDSVEDVDYKEFPKCGCLGKSFVLLTVDASIGQGMQIDDKLAAKYDVKVNEGQGIILVKLSGSDNAKSLVDDIRKRAKVRHHQESREL